jgi:two-component system response regulator HupR/HoxA
MIGEKRKIENLTAGKEQSAICISQSAMDMLGNYPWPGNVRELENEIKRICTLYTDIKIIEESMCSESIRNYPTVEMPRISFNPNRRASLKELTDTFQVNIITEAVTKCKGNMARTARLLGCTRAVLYKKIGRLKISL